MRTLILSLFLLMLCLNLYAQNYSPRFVKVKYSYIIENVVYESQLNELKSDLLQIKGVDEVKFEYKPEKQKAKAIIYTTQKIRQSEADEEFKITALKQAILKHQMLPAQLTEEVVD